MSRRSLSPSTTRRLLSALAGAALAASLLSACGGSSSADDSDAGSQQSADDARVKFAQCMRENGISDFPDPQPGEQGVRIGSGDIKEDQDTMDAASDKCQPILQDAMPAGADDPATAAERQDAILKMTQCVRDKGFDIPDPQVSTSGGLTRVQPAAGDMEKMQKLMQDPDFQSAMDECQEASGMPGPGGPGPGGDTTTGGS
jgi:hypothetical protein